MFRILQTGHNSNRHYYLSLSGFELYGDLLLNFESAVSQSRGLKFNWEYDFDVNGVLYWLGTKKGTKAWQNPMKFGLVRVFTSSWAANSANPSCVVTRGVKNHYKIHGFVLI